jgi:ABC-type phosphate transport system substrate-binding protein
MIRHNIRGALLGTCAVAALALAAPQGAQAQVTQINGGGSTLAAKIYGQVFTNVQNLIPLTENWNYAAVGSGAGARGVLCNDGSQVPINGSNPSVVHYGASDNPLSSSQITAWNNNTAQASCNVQNGGLALGGPLLQIPTIGTPVTLAYNNAGETANGTLTFTDTQLCGIFSGAITSWTDSRLSGIGGGRHPPTGALTVIYRSDGSGTSALFTAHLNSVCPATNGPDNISFTSTQTFASLFPGATPPTNFIGASGSGGVQASIGLPAAETGGAATGHPGAIGYLSPDYTQASPSNTGSSLYAPVAALVNATTGTPMLPNYNNTVAALGTAPLPNLAATGMTMLTRGTALVPTAPNPGVGYPIVGYTTMILPVCYQDPTNVVVNSIYQFLTQIYTTANYIALVQAQGFVQLPTGLLGVINANVLNNNNGYNIDIDDANICQNNGVSGPGTYVGR